MRRLDWDDLRFFLSVASNGTLSAAARDLTVNTTTVLRRIASLEDALSGGDDYQLLFASAESVTNGVCIGELSSELGLRLDGKDVEIHGYQHFSA